jgi:putative nucleotidyltransferase with HDIG domain
MNPLIAQELTAAVDRMPAFPRSVQRILTLAQDAGSTPKDLVAVIDHDPVLTAKMLRVVNSAYFRLPKQISSIGHAVVFLGFNATKNLALGMAAIGMLPSENTAGFDWCDYLLHSVTTAAIARRLAARVSDADPMECFVAGLLHDFGKVVMARSMPDELQQALEACHQDASSLHLALQARLGTDHAAAGAMLVERWRFSPSLVETIQNQYGDNLKDTGMIACVFAANQICKKLRFGFAGNPFVSELPTRIAERLGGPLDDVIASLGDLGPLLEESRLFATT